MLSVKALRIWPETHPNHRFPLESKSEGTPGAPGARTCVAKPGESLWADLGKPKFDLVCLKMHFVCSVFYGVPRKGLTIGLWDSC